MSGQRPRLPDPPALVTEPRYDEAGGTTVDVPEVEDDDPTADLGTDLLGTTKDAGQPYAAGPVAGLAAGSQRTRVW